MKPKLRFAKLKAFFTRGKAGAAIAPWWPVSHKTTITAAVAPTLIPMDVYDKSRCSMHQVLLTPKQLQEWSQIDRRLEKIFWQLVNLWPGEALKINSIWRTRKQDRELGGSGIHAAGPPYRAIDVSIRTLNSGQEAADHIAEVLNSLWVYDPTRPHMVVCYTAPHGEGPHVHLQVHPNTVRKT